MNRPIGISSSILDHIQMLTLLCLSLTWSLTNGQLYGGTTVRNRKPNIILMVGDDIGWADPERHDPQMRTPNLNRLAATGMFLNQSYVLPTCAPTRSALLTGRWPYTYGMQVNQIKGNRLAWLNETLKLLPASLREVGYSTHMIGKWHLGYCDWALTPTRRGFDTFYGFYSAASGYFNHSGETDRTYDFRDNDEIVWSARGKYSTELHSARAERIIREHRNHERPFFLYMAYQNAHAPFEAKESYVTKYCSHVEDRNRRIHCGMVAAMDESIGNITTALEEEGYSNNTIIVFMSDNGGPLEGSSFNYPLRGQKSTLWEGGTRSFTIINSPFLRRTGTVYSGLVHAVDWYPTFMEAAGGTAPAAGLDGLAMWHTLRRNQPSPRSEFVYNVDDYNNRSAIRWNQWKLIDGLPANQFFGWYPSPSMEANGTQWEEVPRRLVPRWHLYNIQADPEERVNVYTSPENLELTTFLKRKLQDYTARLQPYVEALPASGTRNRRRRPRRANSPGWCRVKTNNFI